MAKKKANEAYLKISLIGKINLSHSGPLFCPAATPMAWCKKVLRFGWLFRYIFA
jgi:hypothetical protein